MCSTLLEKRRYGNSALDIQVRNVYCKQYASKNNLVVMQTFHYFFKNSVYSQLCIVIRSFVSWYSSVLNNRPVYFGMIVAWWNLIFILFEYPVYRDELNTSCLQLNKTLCPNLRCQSMLWMFNFQVSWDIFVKSSTMWKILFSEM